MSAATRTTMRRPLTGAVSHIQRVACRAWALWCALCLVAVRTTLIVGALVVELMGRPPVWLAVLGLVVMVAVSRARVRRQRRRGALPQGEALAIVREDCARYGGGAFIGVTEDGREVHHAPAEAAVLVLGPPRSGKTSGVIVPSVLTAPGAAVVTSTKPDVLMASARARSLRGHIWHFDPSGQSHDLPVGVRQLRWSPLDAAGTWESARRVAKAMVEASSSGKEAKGESHWKSRASALIAAQLYAVAINEHEGGRSIETVVHAVLNGDEEGAEQILREAATNPALGPDRDALLALKVLAGVTKAATEEKMSIRSAAATALDAYAVNEAIAVGTNCNFNPAEFVRSGNTVFITASAAYQASCAPLVVALLEAIRDAQYLRHRGDALAGRQTWPPTTFVLDELCNIAPLPSLPALVSEAGGQGLHVIGAIQDLSQVRSRWGDSVAEGFMSLFQHVLILGGIRDVKTLDAISVLCGEYYRTSISTSVSTSHGHQRFDLKSKLHSNLGTNLSTSTSEVRERIVPAGEVYSQPAGTALYLYGSSWGRVRLAAHFAHPRWRAALACAPAQIQTWHHPDDVGDVVPVELLRAARAAHPAFASADTPVRLNGRGGHALSAGGHVNGHSNGHGGHPVSGNGQERGQGGHDGGQGSSDDGQPPGQGGGA
jgi:type IV secretion system protein VirD4